MHRRTLFAVLALFAGLAFAAPAFAAPAGALPLERIALPPGFRIEVWARVDAPRAMALGKHTLFVGSTNENTVHAIPFDERYRAGTPRRLAAEMRMPVGVAFRDGALYASAIDRILRWDDIESRLADPPAPVVVSDDFPSDRSHGWKFIAFGPDGKLYVPVGAPCNICEPDPDRYANIQRMNADGSAREVFARGVRNTVGFDWHPLSGELWFTDNGRDRLGDDVPADELNRADRSGRHFGYPYCHAGTVPDPEYGARRACSEFTAPAQRLGAHVAATGMRFYTGRQFPPEYRNQIFIAEHGSWNRSEKAGYRVTLVRLEGDRAVSYEAFATGWLQPDGQVWGRPADVLVLPDGSLLVSDDVAGAIYRITHSGGGR